MAASENSIKHLTDNLRQMTADLETVNPWAGLVRVLGIGIVFLGLVTLAWLQQHIEYFCLLIFISSWFYTFWLICIHDVTHHTLIGCFWLEEVIARLISWPIVFPHGVYSQLHRLHHGWNGIDLRDPERVQWTTEEYAKVSQLRRWYIRHQWLIDIFVFGSLGLIVKAFVKGWRFRSLVPQLRSQIIVDIIGILVIHSTLAYVVFIHHQFLRYLLFWLIIERTVGVMMQIRDHLEHYGLWGKAQNHQLTQLYSSRNFKSNTFLTWLMGGLNYHAVHHAFPAIPFNRLGEAFQRIQTLLAENGQPPLKIDSGYFGETLNNVNKFSLITTGMTKTH